MREQHGVRFPTMDASTAPTSDAPSRAVRIVAWSSLVLTVLVILGGAVVRATDSGAGCGESWPRCDGHLIPVSPEGATVIEFTHRMMTGALGIALVALVILVVRNYTRGSQVRTMMWWSVGFFFGEVVIGAVLVLFGWVEDDASIGRVIAVNLHLINTFLLLGAMALTAHLASGGAPIRVNLRRSRDRLVIAGVVTLLVVGASGALNALADTLYPAGSVIEGIRAEFGSTAPFLVRLRTIHPVIAIGGAGIIFMLTRAPSLADQGRSAGLALAIQGLLGVQLIMGLLNVALLTPVETQVLHLLIADVLWILWVLFGAEVVGVRTTKASSMAEPA